MKICGIIAEYNPFHKGHAHQIAETRKKLGEDTAIVCLMSGDWVQRGEAALLPKQARATMALQSGADLVLELPLPWALSSAERFASGGVSILSRLGAVTHLSFGAEHPVLADILELGEILREQQTIQDTIKEMQSGISFAAARERALYKKVQERAALLRSPNNILAVEYCKAIGVQDSSLEPVLIPRAGAGHDAAETADGMASASEIRRRLRAGEDVQELVPAQNIGLLEQTVQEGHALLDTGRLEAMMLAKLITMTPEQLGRLPDATEGIENRLWQAIREHRTLEDIVKASTTKRYPAARLRRMLCCAFLGITRADSQGAPPYVKVLAFNDRGRSVLHQLRKSAGIPVLTKPAHGQKLEGDARALLEKEALAADLHALARPAWPTSRSGAEWLRGPVYLPGDKE